MTKKIQLGHVDVDAGMVWIGDPCYVLGSDSSSGPRTWDEFCSKVSDTGYFEGRASHCEPLGAGIGFAIESGYGDGSYPVTVELDNQGRVKSLTVDFQPDDNEE